MTTRAKINFLQYDFIQYLRNLDSDSKPKFGKMNPQQMVEHFTWAVQLASGKVPVSPINEGEEAEKKYRWMMDLETKFKENTPNQLLPDEPLKITSPSMGDAIDDLEDALAEFVVLFKKDSTLKILNPYFGELDYYEQTQLLYKHGKHHARQFAMEI
jgi:hypothetical protein